MSKLLDEIKEVACAAMYEQLKYDADVLQGILYDEALKGNTEYKFFIHSSYPNKKSDGEMVACFSPTNTVYALYVSNKQLFINCMTLEGFCVYQENGYDVLSLNNSRTVI